MVSKALHGCFLLSHLTVYSVSLLEFQGQNWKTPLAVYASQDLCTFHVLHPEHFSPPCPLNLEIPVHLLILSLSVSWESLSRCSEPFTEWYFFPFLSEHLPLFVTIYSWVIIWKFLFKEYVCSPIVSVLVLLFIGIVPGSWKVFNTYFWRNKLIYLYINLCHYFRLFLWAIFPVMTWMDQNVQNQF